MENNHLSVIIPTYREPEALELCLKSAIEGQKLCNEIIVVVDGFYEENAHILKKYANKTKILVFNENQGLCRSINTGVYNASNKLVFVVNDDNVFDKDWDIKLIEQYEDKTVLTPNQVEPYNSIFKQFIIKDLGRQPDDFDLDEFWEFTSSINENKITDEGGTLPFLISKEDYLKVGGWDESYPDGLVADWEFFIKCGLSGIKLKRTYNTHFYHFVSISLSTPEKSKTKQVKEQNAHIYFKYKWGFYAYNNLLN